VRGLLRRTDYLRYIRRATVSDFHEREQAVHAYHSYVTSMLASHTQNGLGDGTLYQAVEVSKADVLNRFLSVYPRWERFRATLAGECPELAAFPLMAGR
jgi:hypothetical protein